MTVFFYYLFFNVYRIFRDSPAFIFGIVIRGMLILLLKIFTALSKKQFLVLFIFVVVLCFLLVLLALSLICSVFRL